MPLVSVVIPTFNRENYISETIKSIQAQTINDLEIIVIDDGSNDGTQKIIESLSQTDQRIRYIAQQNSGVSIARNNGLDLARGKYVAFIDSDDIILPPHLEYLVDAIEQRSDAQIAVALSNFRFFGLERNAQENETAFKTSIVRALDLAFESKGQGAWVSNDDLLSTLLQHGFPFRMPASLIARELLSTSRIRFEPDIKYLEDAQFMTHLSYFTNFLFVDQKTYLIRKHLENANDTKYSPLFASSLKKKAECTDFFFRGKPMSMKQRKALSVFNFKCLSQAAFEQSKNQNFFGRAKISACLFIKSPSIKSAKAGIKVLLQLQRN
jgi:glycosyltransferase involved in cell wall biosynthesis